MNIGANKDSADRIADYAAGVELFADLASYLTVNISSPNTPGLRDLQTRGLLDNTLVIWCGDFGRTPRINARGAQPGRDHYPRAWSSVMLGGGIRGGQVIGRTDAEAATVTDRPVGTFDYMATVCRALGIDYNKQNQAPNGRPIRRAKRQARPPPADGGKGGGHQRQQQRCQHRCGKA